MDSYRKTRALMLSIGYGEGHRSAARGLGDALTKRGAIISQHDPMSECSLNKVYEITRSYYRFCVRYAPLLWRLTYNGTDSSDWQRMAEAFFFRPLMRRISQLITEQRPDIIFCTYPLYGYFLDKLRDEGVLTVPYVMVVTDSLEISRPWLRCQADCWQLLDEYSEHCMVERYALDSSKIVVSAFPVSPRFVINHQLTPPSDTSLRIIYACYGSLSQLKGEVSALLQGLPQLQLTLLAGDRSEIVQDFIDNNYPTHSVGVLGYRDDMDELLRQHHIYVGKAGAATVFEAYQTAIPLIINYALPGQEQGNLRLLQLDGCGIEARGGAELLSTVRLLLQDDSKSWKRMRARMQSHPRSGGADRLLDALAQRFFSHDRTSD